ncbi:precorrin-3B C(17)-methyltransferase [Anabaena sp. FACHB-1237]|uniref:precorrin-3B C(17)-methyltransferase n=1 Tax=Anabaena sp. FACHB-1237 TaxID=2692769 RepID=UPI0016814C4B|nr:precorrin-3B C(17)-methyltransferase [Anabaena sp. FACHB-1237]MBD2137015.1 precorrin-3B C(17)-methyltransferase [Anabaena sp. FACHB-1237]
MKKSPAIIILNQHSLNIGRKITDILPNSQLYGLNNRTENVDITFTNFGETVRELFISGTPIIGICAAGILIRTLAPLLTNKAQEPPILAIAEDGSAVVPLLGGLNGVNDLAREISQTLNVQPAITTTGDLRFRTALLSPPTGYYLANGENGKKFIADLLAGATVKVIGNAPWLTNSNLPIDDHSELTIIVTEKTIIPQVNTLLYHPQNLILAISQITSESLNQIYQLLGNNQVSQHSLSLIIAPLNLAANPILTDMVNILNLPIRFLPNSQNCDFQSLANQYSWNIITSLSDHLAIFQSSHIVDPENIGQPRGKLAIIGTGPGASKWLSPEVKQILTSATDLVGYKTYINLIGKLADGKNIHESDNREEIYRAKQALNLAAQGKYVAVVSSGDPGIYAMAAAVFEAIDKYSQPEWQSIEIQVTPGISAMQAAAASIGAPLGHDFCVISLSDILKPWDIISQRISKAAESDLAIAFYNPVSKERTWQLAAAKKILLEHRKPQTPVILGKNMGRTGQKINVITLEELEPNLADMRTVIIIGSSHTRKIQQNDYQNWVYTSRSYSYPPHM